MENVTAHQLVDRLRDLSAWYEKNLHFAYVAHFSAQSNTKSYLENIEHDEATSMPSVQWVREMSEKMSPKG